MRNAKRLPALHKPGAAHEPARDPRGPWAGPALAWYFVFIACILDICLIYLEMFGYIFLVSLIVYFLLKILPWRPISTKYA